MRLIRWFAGRGIRGVIEEIRIRVRHAIFSRDTEYYLEIQMQTQRRVAASSHAP